jgi:HEAT repeat protein/Na+/melibiose symporter-like transporter
MSAEPSSPAAVEPTTAEKIRLLPWGIASNSANAVFIQFTFFGSAFVLFLNQLQLNNTQVGFLLSLFPFFGLVALFIAPAVARFGYKRTYLTFYGARKVVAAFLLLTPWILSRFGTQAALGFVMVIVVLFALCRATAETALYPWIQEIIPNSIRGKYAATSNFFSQLSGVAAAAVGGAILSSVAGLNGFMVLIAIGVLFGFLSVWAVSFRPGGAATVSEGENRRSTRDMLNAIRDRNYSRYLIGLGLITVATVPMVAFLPLYMRAEVGLSTGEVVWLQTGTLVGGLVSTFLWGWAADRYGSKPVMMFGLYAQLLLPLGWMLMPQNSRYSLYAALGIAMLQGVASLSWTIGSGRLLYVSVVPPDKKSEYLAVYYAAVGIFGGVSQLIGGRVLDLSSNLHGRFLLFDLNPHVPLFLVGLILPVASLFIFRKVQSDSQITIGEFAGLFLHGNPFYALGTLPRYYWARDERAAVSVTERLGRSQSPLTAEELLDALADPRFNVRFEAIISIARMRPDPRFVRALESIVTGTELSLTVIAAWALGRMGDTNALQTLRQGLDSEYRSIRAHCARALGSLGDQQVVPLLLQRLKVETDKGLQMAYASALGNLEAAEAAPVLVETLVAFDNEGARQELALAIARLLGDERNLVGLFRQTRTDAGTAIAQELTGIEKRLAKSHAEDGPLRHTLSRAADLFARQELEEGVALLSCSMRAWLADDVVTASQTTRTILSSLADQLDVATATRMEFILLSLHTLEISSRGELGENHRR